MPLFASRRDSSFMLSLNNELVDKVIGIEILYYKLSIQYSKTSIYDETTEKVYFPAVAIPTYVLKQDVQMEDTELGVLESTQTVSFGFIRDQLDNLGIVLEVGDIIRWDSGFYEIDNVRKENYWWGRNPHEFIAHERGVVPPQGWAYSVAVDTHRSSATAVNIAQIRQGTNPVEGTTHKFKGF